MPNCIHYERTYGTCQHFALNHDLVPTFGPGSISEESLRIAAEYRKIGMLIRLAKHPVNTDDTEAFCDATNQETCEGFSTLLSSQRHRR